MVVVQLTGLPTTRPVNWSRQAHKVPSSCKSLCGSLLPFTSVRRTVLRTPRQNVVRTAAVLQKEDYGIDYDKEASRVFMRTVFDLERWQAHRSTGRYLRHMKGLLGSRIVKSLYGPLNYVVFLSLILCAYETSLDAGYLPSWAPDLALNVKEVFSLTSFALSLLLVFRTNSSYGRWDEARKLWGGAVNRSRDFARQGFNFFDPEAASLREAHGRWTMAFSKTLMCHLRLDRKVEEELKGILHEDELAMLLKSDHRPNFVLRVMGEIVKQGKLQESQNYRMDSNLTYFADVVGACERIMRTPIPLTYTRHTSRFLLLWLTCLPFTLWGSCKWGTPAISAIIAFLLLGIEEIGVQIEEPFSILPLEAISGTIEKNIREMMDFEKKAQELVPYETAASRLKSADQSMVVGRPFAVNAVNPTVVDVTNGTYVSSVSVDEF